MDAAAPPWLQAATDVVVGGAAVGPVVGGVVESPVELRGAATDGSGWLPAPAAPAPAPAAPAAATPASHAPEPAPAPTVPDLPVSAAVFVYRISSGGYAKVKPPYITKQACLVNFCAAVLQLAATYPTLPLTLLLWRDCCTPALARFAGDAVTRLLAPRVAVVVRDSEFGDGAASFNAAVAAALALPLPLPLPPPLARESTAVYMVEDDYLHTKEALRALLSGLALAPYVTGYDHADKYTPGFMGACHVLAGATCHWRTVRSTTMTFAARLSTLADDLAVMHEFTGAAPPDDHHMWLALGVRGRVLLSPLPAVSTHGETAWLSPFVNWGELGAQAGAWARKLAT